MTDRPDTHDREPPEVRLATLLVFQRAPAILAFRHELDGRLRGEGEAFIVLTLDAPTAANVTERRLLAIPHDSDDALLTPSLLATVHVDELDDMLANRWNERALDDEPAVTYNSHLLVSALKAEGLESFGPPCGAAPGSWRDLQRSLAERRALTVPVDLRPTLEECPPREPRPRGHRLAWVARPETYRPGNVEVTRGSAGEKMVAFHGDEITPQMAHAGPALGFRIADMLARHLAALYARAVTVVVFHPATGVWGRSAPFGD